MAQRIGYVLGSIRGRSNAWCVARWTRRYACGRRVPTRDTRTRRIRSKLMEDTKEKPST